MARTYVTKINHLFIGKKFGRLLVTGVIRGENGHPYFQCICDCGNKTTTNAGAMKQGKTVSCGCYRTERRTKHGHSTRQTTSGEYISWRAMMCRCYVPKNRRYKRYGGRGIIVCPQWHDFPTFLADMGKRPSLKHSIERRDTNGNYEPSNCYWATDAEQSRNTSRNNLVTFNGVTKCITDWAAIIGITPQALKHRIRNWTFESAMTLPAGQSPWLHRKRISSSKG